MKRMLVCLIAILMCLKINTPVTAQDATYKCDLPTMQNVLDGLIGELSKVKSSNETDPVKIADVIERATVTANIVRASCDNLLFSGSKQTVLGPVEIPKGLYKVTLTTASDRYVGVKLAVANGKCGEGSGFSLSSLLYNFSDTEGKDGAEIVFASEGCTTLIQVEISNAKWELKFERLSTS